MVTFKSICVVLIMNILSIHGHVNIVDAESSRNSLALTQALNLVRQESIQEMCRIFPPRHNIDELPVKRLDHILINEKHKLLYCYVPKVACTNWKRILMILDDKWNNTDVLSIPASLAHSERMFRNLSSVSEKERTYMLENYQKLIIVRNPFERLLSAFRNKLEGNFMSSKYFQEHVGRRIIKVFRDNPSKESLEHGHDVTFQEFAMFLTNRSGELADIVHNEHWEPVTNLCHPCLIKYTLVGKYDTLLDDSTLALHSINASHIEFPHLTRTSGTSKKIGQYFSKLPLSVIKRLYKLYRYDYKLFDYDLKNVIGFDLG